MDHKNTSVMTKTNTIEIEGNAKEDRGGAVWTEPAPQSPLHPWPSDHMATILMRITHENHYIVPFNVYLVNIRYDNASTFSSHALLTIWEQY